MDKELMEIMLTKAVAGMDNAQLGELLKEVWVARKARGSVSLTPAEIIRDMFLEGDLHKVPSKKQLEVGKPEAATGGDAEHMVNEYSDFAPQTPNGRTMNYEKLEAEFGDMKAGMKSMAEALKTLTEIVTVKATEAAKGKEDEEEEVEVEVNEKEDEGKGKALRAQVTKTILSKAEEEEEEGGDMEEEEEEGKGKALSDASKVKFVKALIGGAEDALKKGEGKGLIREVEKAVRKALALATAAAESKDKETVKSAKDALVQVEEFMFLHDIATKGKKGKKDGMNQKKWPDKDGVEKSITELQGQLHGLVNTIENLSRGRSGYPQIEVLGADSPLSKGGANYFDEKMKGLAEKGAAGMISEADQGAAEELINLMQAVSAGRVPETVVKNTLLRASSNVKAHFPEWLEKAA